MTTATAIVFSHGSASLPAGVRGWLAKSAVPVVETDRADEVVVMALRARPRIIILDGRGSDAPMALEIVRRLKADAVTAIAPVVLLTDASDQELQDAVAAGADEVVRAIDSSEVAGARLTMSIRRSERDVRVHPTTRLPGAAEIDAEIALRMERGIPFAACYADLDSFKEFNDRYSYFEGDRVIRIVSMILHDLVTGSCGSDGFVGHIGGDDFIFLIPVEMVPPVCTDVIDLFDTLVPFQYSEEDRQRGYFFGKDRRGELHRVPLMTVSIGVVSTERRRFTHAAQVSALATEMKSYAKTFPGSVFMIDRRQDEPTSPTVPAHPAGGADQGGGTA